MKQPKIAIVHDWLTNMGGAERVVLALHEAFPEAPVYTSTYNPEKLPLFKNVDVRTTWLQKLPGGLGKLHKFFPSMRGRAFRKLDLSEYDIIISSSSAEAKQVKKTHSDQIHICYCHTPIRYYWSHYNEYRSDPGFGKLNWLIRLAMPLFVPALKKADYKAAQKIDLFIANSNAVKERIKKYYGKPSIVINPPVDVGRFTPPPASQNPRHGFVALGRQEPYKRIDLAVAACTKLNLPLSVYGNGSQHARLQKMAGPSVKFIVGASDQKIAEALQKAVGFIFPAEEDFGIVQVEALAAGTPVVAYGKGGSLDIIQDNMNGVLFQPQTTGALIEAIKRLESHSFQPASLHRQAKRFHKTLFISKIRKVIADQIITQP